MPFIDEIINQINSSLKAGSLNNEKLQPAKYLGIATTVARIKDAKKKSDLEILPAIVSPTGTLSFITPEKSYGIQIYHRLLNKQYSRVKASYGDDYDYKMVSELTLVVLTNSKVTGRAKEALEPLVLFGMPQTVTPALLAELQINSCVIYPTASNLDAVSVFRQEYPNSVYFLNDQSSIFSVRYKIEMSFSKACINKCLCA